LLHKTSRILGFHIHASDGPIGHVDDFLVDERDWTVRYLVVDTSNWIGGKSVLIAASTIVSVDAVQRQIVVKLSRAQIENGPTVDTADIDPVETLPSLWIM
jgi:hypothetical protein